MRVKSIAFKLWLGMMALVVFMLGLLWTFQIAFLQNSYIEGKAEALNVYANSLAAMLEQSSTSTMDYINQLNDSFNVSTLLVAPNGNIQYVSKEYAGSLLGDCLSRSAAIMENGLSYSDYVIRERYALRYVRSAVPIEGGGVVFLIMPVSDVSGTVEILKFQFLYLSIIMVSASIIIATILARFITKPVLKLNYQAGKMAKGDLATPFEPETYDEIGELTETMEHMRESLLQEEKLRRELVANTSHELRTPLAIIRGFAETVRDVTFGNAQKRDKQLNAIIDESVRLERIVNEILDYSQMQAGSTKYDIHSVELSELCESVSERMREYVNAGHIALNAEIEPGITVNGDEGKLNQVLTNLIANAFNHSPQDTAITLRLRLAEGLARVEVQDQGEGIAKEDLPYIWDRYYRTTLKGREERIGSGLGLAVCKSILEAHGARFGVESELGVGSLFAFEMPVVKKAAISTPDKDDYES